MQDPYRVDSELNGWFTSPENAPAKWLVMLRAYFDESGHENKGWTFLAGFIGNDDQWREFVPKWKEALGNRQFLHMKKLRWKLDRTRRLLERLGPIPYQCGLEGCMAGVRYGDYEDLVAGTDDERLLKAWVVAMFPMVMQILRGTPLTERIEFVFEQQDEYEPFVNMAMPIIANAPPMYEKNYRLTPDGKPRIAKWGFVPKGSTVMTDPADYLAFALREAWTDKHSKKTQWCKPMLFDEKGESREGYGVIMNRNRARRTIGRAQDMFIDAEIKDMVSRTRRGLGL